MPRAGKVTLSADPATPPETPDETAHRPPATFPPDRLIEAARSRLRTELDRHYDGAVTETIDRAIDRAIEWHQGQLRKSGEPYAVHPIEVAILLSRMSADTEAICAALLHDVVEDSAVDLDIIREEFGDRVAMLID